MAQLAVDFQLESDILVSPNGIVCAATRQASNKYRQSKLPQSRLLSETELTEKMNKFIVELCRMQILNGTSVLSPNEVNPNVQFDTVASSGRHLSYKIYFTPSRMNTGYASIV